MLALQPLVASIRGVRHFQALIDNVLSQLALNLFYFRLPQGFHRFSNRIYAYLNLFRCRFIRPLRAFLIIHLDSIVFFVSRINDLNRIILCVPNVKAVVYRLS